MALVGLFKACGVDFFNNNNLFSTPILMFTTKYCPGSFYHESTFSYNSLNRTLLAKI